AVADLGLGFSRFAQQALDRAYRLGRAKADRLVEDDPAVEHLTIGGRRSPAGPSRYGRPAARPRGRRRSRLGRAPAARAEASSGRAASIVRSGGSGSRAGPGAILRRRARRRTAERAEG